jgi:hypothetical protein
LNPSQGVISTKKQGVMGDTITSDKRTSDIEIVTSKKDSGFSDSGIRLPSPSTPNPLVAAAPLPPFRGAPPPGRIVRPGPEMDLLEDFCLATGRSFFAKDGKCCVTVPDWLWLQVKVWAARPEHERGIGPICPQP